MAHGPAMPRMTIGYHADYRLPGRRSRENHGSAAVGIEAGGRRTFLGPAPSNNMHREAPLPVQTLLQSTAGTLARVPLLGRFNGVSGWNQAAGTQEITGTRETAPRSGVQVRLLADEGESGPLQTVARTPPGEVDAGRDARTSLGRARVLVVIGRSADRERPGGKNDAAERCEHDS